MRFPQLFVTRPAHDPAAAPRTIVHGAAMVPAVPQSAAAMVSVPPQPQNARGDASPASDTVVYPNLSGRNGNSGNTGAGSGINVPSAYMEGYEKARARDPEMADAYILHTTIGDPLADRVIEELACVIAEGKGREHGIINTALNNYDNPSAIVPESLRDLVAATVTVPPWFDEETAMVATRAFLRNPAQVLAGLATAAIVEGFSVLIAKSFRIRGRLIDSGSRRLKSNNLQLFEQFLPGGMIPGGDAWRLNLRIRLIHAQARCLIRVSDEWDEAECGLPLSAAHMLLGAASFSGRLMQHVQRLGGEFSSEEREAYVHVWKYSGWQMGVPETILFHDEASSVRAYEIGVLCEPPPGDDSIIMANSILNSTPLILNITEPAARRREVGRYYQISRELIGNEMADQLRFPPAKRIPILPLIAFKYRAMRRLAKYLPFFFRYNLKEFNILLNVSNLGKFSHSYRLPSSLYDDDSQKW